MKWSERWKRKRKWSFIGIERIVEVRNGLEQKMESRENVREGNQADGLIRQFESVTNPAG